MGKITIKHYLNKKLNSTLENGIQTHPVYVRVIYNRKNNNFRSEIITKPLLNEFDFEKNKQVLQEIQYETELINAVIQYGEETQKESFSIGNRVCDLLQSFNISIAHDFFGSMIEKEQKTEIKEEIIKYLSEKTEIMKDAINELIAYDICEKDTIIKELIRLNIIPQKQKQLYEYMFCLVDYENLKFGLDRSHYGINKNFNFLEWRFRGGKQLFLKYIKEKSVLDESIINDITLEFENRIKENFKFVLNYNVLLNKRN